jgi:protein-tyrosine-phosphatase
MKKVVFICHGDMFRSQVAKAFYNKYKTDEGRACSYGTNVSDRMLQGIKLGDWSGLEILISEMKRYDVDISNEYSDQLKEEYLKDADKIVVMAEREYIPNWLEKYGYEYWEIPNPEVHVSKEIEEIVKLIREKVIKLIELNK